MNELEVRPTGQCPATIMIVGEFPGEQEVLKGMPFVGYAGKELDLMLLEAGIRRSDCFVTNVIRVRPPANDIANFIAEKKSAITPSHVEVLGKSVLPVVRDGIELLKREIESCRPNVIIALGNVSLWALTGEWGITAWRGSTNACTLPLNLPYAPKVLSTYPPSMVLRQWSWRQIVINDLKRAAKEAKFPELIQRDYSILTSPDYGTVMATLTQLLAHAAKGPFDLSVDIETAAGHIDILGLAWSKTEALVIPFFSRGDASPYWKSDEEESSIVWALYKLLTHPNCKVVGQNFAYDAQYIFRHFLFIPNLRNDTMLAQHSCFSNLQKSLAFLASMYCEHYQYWKDELHGSDEVRQRYNGKDCCITFEVNEVLQRVVDTLGMREVYSFQMRLWWPVVETMNRGLNVDTRSRAQFAMELMEEIAKREQWLIDVLGFPVNIKSPKQMQELFYDLLRQKPIINRKTGTVSCDDESLRKLAEREPILLPITRKISELRSLGVFLSTFVNAPLDTDGRMRCSFNIAGTETYRFSSSQNAFGSGLNLQNIPKGGDAGEGLELPNVRSLFIPDAGKTFFDIDLAAADLRIVVWESDEPEMKSMLKADLDPYTEIAKEFYNDPNINKKDPRRQTFKSFAHGTNYLGTAKGLAERLGLLVHDAERTQKWYFERFPKIKKWQDDLKDQVFKRRMVQNVFGYRQYFFDRIEGTIFNQAAAWIPQSTVACLINRAYVAIHEQLPYVEVLLQVHDSLAGQFPSYMGDEAVRAIVKCAEIELPYDDPLIIPVGVVTSKDSWGGCK